ncbi:MAG: hypothetical protein AUI10_03425 [Actinobacteria bacterium 13_2_20CM_2_72_6]|jgi:hypothetical protein|nr:MAG: hypothetical protein AUI10_03425 [Actinobacteria bacterium 13_2_20CM_2_72_6]
MAPPVMSEWTVPAPPRTATDRPIRGWRIGAGIVLAVSAHLVLTGSGVALFRSGFGDAYLEGGGFLGFVLLLAIQGALVVCCALPGFLLLLFGDRGFGIGLLIGWAAGVAPLVLLGYLTVSAARTM